jgi:hypothetical protein
MRSRWRAFLLLRLDLGSEKAFFAAILQAPFLQIAQAQRGRI